MGQNLPEIFAVRPILGSATDKSDLTYIVDVSQAGINKDRGMTRQETSRAWAEDFKKCASAFVVPFRGNITGLTGGGANNLDGILDGLVLADVQVPCCVDLSVADTMTRFKLRLGAEPEDGYSIIVPDNVVFAGYVWVRISG